VLQVFFFLLLFLSTRPARSSPSHLFCCWSLSQLPTAAPSASAALSRRPCVLHVRRVRAGRVPHLVWLAAQRIEGGACVTRATHFASP